MTAKTSMQHQGNPLALASEQLKLLAPTQNAAQFQSMIADAGHESLLADRIEILQVNLGKLCNMTCAHCHVDAGPDRREIMQASEVDACIDVLTANEEIRILDLTGGAPEMNPDFRRLVTAARDLDRHVIDRCNLTILLATGYEDLPEFLAEQRVEIVASLPCYLEENTDAQRGDGAFSKSIDALRRLNELGYGAGEGQDENGLMLTLVYNPVGPSLPPPQAQLESDYRSQLKSRFDISFDRLITITNMPVSRYLDYLIQTGDYEAYMNKLVDAFNPGAISGLMCRNTLSVGWDGRLFDCDFNQMLELATNDTCPQTIHEFSKERLANREIVTGQHCFGCTAGSGSGCQGSTVSPVEN